MAGLLSALERWQIRVTGVVQGVGFRPFAQHLASGLGLTGHVGNDPSGVFIEVQGELPLLRLFADGLRRGAPRLAVVESVTSTPVAVLPHETEFVIVASRDIAADDVALLPPDTAMCDDCQAELVTPGDRREGYPFIACTHCGPRFTIVRGLPYDRPSTTMAAFPLCDECEAEYEDPSDRRFHAQPVACATCGPHAWFVGPNSRTEGDAEAITAASFALMNGDIVAIKGVGGFHLACDAHNPRAVAHLRTRKGRGAKPFAVMMRDVATAAKYVELNDHSRSTLQSPAAPIVVLPATELGADLVANVAPGNHTLGVMLPYSPLHHLLFARLPLVFDVLVMTSGNRADEPIAIDDREASDRLASLADGFLHHNREIAAPCDDSVIRYGVGPIRRSRGLVPLPITLPFTSTHLLAVGGELKATGGVARENHAWLTQHVGDVGSIETARALDTAISVTAALAQVRPTAVVADLHPGYLSQRWARDRAAELNVPLHLVQHHHAHLASLLAEHQVPPNAEVLGFTFDGTGYGLDGTIWGGELLLGSYAGVTRVGHLREVLLPGGDAATKRPPRIAVAHLVAAGLDPHAANCDIDELRILLTMLSSGTHCTPTSSMGRLFDAVSSLLGVCQDVAYEGQAAIELESLAFSAGDAEPLAFELDLDDELVVLNPASVLKQALARLADGESAPALARAFHVGLADVMVAAAEVVRQRTGVNTVGLSGGVFTNELLTREAVDRLTQAGFDVLTHQLVPANDGGLALGQLAVAACGGQVSTSHPTKGN